MVRTYEPEPFEFEEELGGTGCSGACNCSRCRHEMERELSGLESGLWAEDEAVYETPRNPVLSRRTPVTKRSLLGPLTDCPGSIQETVSGFSRYQNSVSSLPPKEQQKIRNIARLIVRSFQLGCPPVVIVQLTGHADLDPQREGREPGFMLKISRQRALAVKQALERLINNRTISARIAWDVLGVGASQIAVPNPRTEQERRRNRRVQIWLATVNPASPPFIRWVQNCCNKVLGTRLAVNGVMGAETRTAVRSFQQRQGLVVTGIVTPPTIASLIRVCGNLPNVLPTTIPQIQIISPADNTQWPITGEPRMPVINAEARIVGISPDPTPSTDFEWKVQIRFDSRSCPHGICQDRRRHPICVDGQPLQINPPDIVQTVAGGRFTPTFPRIRGGDLTIIVRASVGGQILEARTTGVKIVGTNPQRADVQAALPHDTLRRIACDESGQRQFLAPANGGVGPCPLFSGDNKLGVGIKQITFPRPTDDDIWDWRHNVATGVRIFNQKLQAARNYPGAVRRSAGFRDLVNNFNQARQTQGSPPVRVILPDFTTGNFDNNLQQLEVDAIRCYNGTPRFVPDPLTGQLREWGQFGLGLHEFRVALNPDGSLRVINIDPRTMTGEAVWERVPVADRPQNSGDPDYVNHVLRQNPRC